MNIENKTLKTCSGIDTLYYFCESNENYDDLFLDMLDQMEDIKGIFDRKEIEYRPNDIHITLKDMTFEHLGKNEGFYWFRDTNEYFKIGFKDMMKNRGLHNIRVQLQAEGIYTLGLPTLLKLINKTLLGEYTTGNFPITRIDLNCFVEYDLSFATKEMFVSRKRHYSQIAEIGSAKRTQTIYVGKPPFRLRMYDKRLEMKQSKKSELMTEYFLNQGFDLSKELFNVEFEIHRTHLKAFGIDTIQDALENAQSLFQSAMDEIRLIDINSITKKAIKNNTKNKALALSIWNEIRNDYNIEAFMQNVLPVERVKRKMAFYDDYKFKKEFIQLVRKAYIHGIYPSVKLMGEYKQEAVDSLLLLGNKPQIEPKYTKVEFIDSKGNKDRYRLFDTGELIKPLTVRLAKRMSDYELQCYLDELAQGKMSSNTELKRYQITYEEAIRRGLVLDIPF